MTTTFWKWLSRANARTALVVAVIAFLVAAGYWVWRELDQVGPESIYPAGASRTDVYPTNKVELLGFIKIQQANPEKASNNPFYRRRQDNPQPPANNNPPANVDNNTPKPPPKVVVTTPKPNPPPPPPPPPKETPMMYRGLMQRADGSRAALIENQDTKKQHFFAAGDAVFKNKVDGIGPDSVSLKKPNGETLVLARGQVVRIRED